MKPRTLAVKIILQVLQHGMSLTEAFNQLLTSKNADTGLIKEICYGSIRWYPRLQAICHSLLAKPFKTKDKDLEILIIIGLYQLMAMRIAEHAAVTETVEVVRELGKSWASGLMNAVLRNFQRQKDALIAKADLKPEASSAHPLWLLQKLQLAWPDHWPAITSANNQYPPLTLRVNLQKQTRENYLQLLAAENIIAAAAPYSAAAIFLDTPSDVTTLPDFKNGVVSVQDLSAQLAAELLDLQPGQHVLDACAAPGGKTAHILETEPALGALIALDKDAKRLLRVKENLSRLNLVATLIAADAALTHAWFDGKLFDRILLDAPCSALGVIRRHPDIKYLRRETDFLTLPQQQLRLLTALWPLLKPQGILVYATCSVMPEENNLLIQQFLNLHTDAQELKITASWGISMPVGRQVLPGQDNMDGFYYARLQKS